ncbi:MAG: SDR family oxidoreductase [Bacteroidetes bacterium]|nr:SDR family oxidoreductase [Bacteroidota bacterium]
MEREAVSLEVLVNNAGYLKNAPFEELTISEWRNVYEANLFGPVNLIKQLLPLLKKGKLSGSSGFKSHIVNIGSIGGVQGSSKFKGLSAYSSSKGALSVLTECLAEEFKEDLIAVNCLALGSVQTEMFSEAFPGFTAAKQPEEMGTYIGKFAMEGSMFFNGKILEVSISTP